MFLKLFLYLNWLSLNTAYLLFQKRQSVKYFFCLGLIFIFLKTAIFCHMIPGMLSTFELGKFRPVLCPIYLGRLKSTIKMCIFYCIIYVPWQLILNLFAGVNFVIKAMYGTDGISHLILNNIMFLKVFFYFTWFSTNAAYLSCQEC